MKPKQRLYILSLTGVLFLLAALPFKLAAQATATYYVSSSTGNDANDGLSEATPWQTLDKAKSTILPDNAHILFKRNDVFRGEFSLLKSPVGIHVGAYGTGDNPVFAGSVAITGWTPTTYPGLPRFVYEASVANLPLTDKGIQYLFVNGELMTIARYPNVDSPADKNWLRVGAGAGKGAFTDPALVAYGKPDDYWTGATLRIRDYSWTFTICPITNYSASNGKITTSQLGNQLPEWGYFLDGKLEELDHPGEWYYDATAQKVYLYPKDSADPNTLLVEGATYDTGLSILEDENNIVIEGLTFRHYLQRGVFLGASDSVTLKNSQFKHNVVGLYVYNPTNVLVTGNTLDRHFKDSIVLQAQEKFDVKNSVVEQNVITNTGIYPAYGIRDEGVYGGIGIAMFGQAFTARQNTIENVSWNGIYLKDGGYHVVENNVIRKALLLLNDGGAISISSDGNVIKGNFLSESVGNVDESNGCMSLNQTPCGHHPSYGMGIGADNNKKDNVIEGNVIYNNADLGIRLNAYVNTLVQNNVLYNNDKQIVMEDKMGPSANNKVENNLMFPLHPDHLGLSMTLDKTTTNHGTSDNNYYCNPYSHIAVERGTQLYSLGHWQKEFPAYDQHSKQCDLYLPEYTTVSLGANLILNSTFDVDVSNWNGSGTATISADATQSQLDGGSLKMVSDGGKGNGNVISNVLSLTANQTYLLKFSVIGNGFGNLQMRLNEIIPGQTSNILAERHFAFDTQRRNYEAVFTSPLTTTSAKFLFITDETSANTYWLDNVSFEPVTATRNDVTQQVTLFPNPTANSTTLPLAKKYFDMDGQEITGSLTLAPWSAKVLMSYDATPVTPPVTPTSVTLTTAKAGNGTGTLTSSAGLGTGINCGTTCTESYNSGTVVTLTATPAAGSIFGGFSGAGCADTLTITANMTCTANFALATTPNVTLTVQATGGKVSSTPTGIDCGTQCTHDYPQGSVVTLTATPDATLVFSTWAGDCTGTVNPTTVTLDAAKTCVATFVPGGPTGVTTQSFTLTKVGNGTVTDSLGGISCGDKCVVQYASPATLTLTATPAAGNQFVGFTGDADCTDGQVTLEKTPVSCVATFAATTTLPVVKPQPANFTLATCSKTGVVNEVCRGNGQTMTVTIGQSGLVSDAILAGKINSQGWVSNVTIANQATFTGGVVTGYITNQGTMADFRFVGASLKGGTLSGKIVNDSKVGGTITDVTLAPNAQITGGRLQGTIKGDPQAPALIDNVRIMAGSHLSGVTLGNNVIKERGVTIEDTQPAEEITLPSLGTAIATDANGKTVNTDTQFEGGIAVNADKTFQTSQEVKTLVDILDIRGKINVANTDVGKTADLIVYVEYQSQKDAQPTSLMIGPKTSYLPWDEELATLVAFQPDVTLKAEQPLEIYEGILLYSGIVQIYFGYRLANGTVVVSAKTMELTVME